jgi:hypothetical protein
MKLKLPLLAAVFSLFATSAMAEMIVINGRYMVQKDQVRAYFYRERGKTVVFDVRWSDWSTQYRCQDKYDKPEVMAASLNFALKVGEQKSLDFLEFLKDQGFRGCKQF